MKNYHIILLCILAMLGTGTAKAQNITQLEYFIDTDPGFGQGTAVATNADTIISQNFTVPLSGVSKGLHTLFVRAKDVNGIWSLTNIQQFYQSDTLLQNITALEYFVDADPGTGNGTQVAVTAGNDVAQTFTVPLGALSKGFHQLFIRAKDAAGLWSLTSRQQFYKIDTTLANITAIEYFFDNNDPGIGHATALPLTPGTNILQAVTIPIDTLSPGRHTLFMRSRDANGVWTLTNYNSFLTPANYALQFDSASSYVNLGNWFKLQTFSISMWVRPDSIQPVSIASFLNTNYNGSNWKFVETVNATNSYFMGYCGSMPLTQLNPSLWQYFTITLDSATHTLSTYLFGQLVAQDNACNISYNNPILQLSHPSSYHWKGLIDEVSVFNRVITNAEILQYMNGQLTGNEAGLQGYWNFDDVRQDSLTDKSPYGHNGAPLNGVKKIISTVPYIGKRVQPDYGGDGGVVTVLIYGANFKQQSTVTLFSSTLGTITADSVVVDGDSSVIMCQFDLTGKARGVYNVVVTPPSNGHVAIYQNAFTVQAQLPDSLEIQSIGSTTLRSGHAYRPVIVFTNRGNTNLYNVPVYITLPPGTVIQKTNFKYYIDPGADSLSLDSMGIAYPIDDTDQIYLAAQGDTVITDSVQSILHMTEIIMILPLLPPGQEYVISLQAQVPDSAWSAPFFLTAVQKNSIIRDGPNWFEQVVDAGAQYTGADEKLAIARANCISEVVDLVGGFIPGFSCITSTFSAAFNSATYQLNKAASAVNWLLGTDYNPWKTDQNTLLGLGQMGLKVVLDCTPAGTLKKGFGVVAKIVRNRYAQKIVVNTHREWENLNHLKDAIVGGVNCFNQERDYLASQQQQVQQVASFDPNEIQGPANKFGLPYFPKSGKPYQYRISFENKSTATAPAQVVVVTDTLDKSKFDLSTFTFSKLGFSDQMYNVPGMFRRNFTYNVPLPAVDTLRVLLSAYLDTAAGTVQWTFTTVDTGTLTLTNDPLAGFLPPDDNAGAGDGFVMFTVNTWPGISNGGLVNNHATVYFDNNSPIVTSTYSVKIDADLPHSSITGSVVFPGDGGGIVSWSGTDATTGVLFYNVYVSVDNDSFLLWRYQTTDVSDSFIAAPGHVYKFFSLATDSAGNVQADTLVHQVTTGIPALQQDGALLYQNIPNPFNNTTRIDFYLPATQQASLQLKDIMGRSIRTLYNGTATEGRHTINMNTDDLQPGIYLYQLNVGQATISKRMVIE